MRLPVTIVAGLHEEIRRDVVARLLATAARPCVVVEHDFSAVGDGLVSRTVRDASGVRSCDVVQLAHACASCTLRESILPTLLELADGGAYAAIVLDLPSGVEPQQVADAIDECRVGEVPVWEVLRVAAVVTAVDPERAIEEFDADDTLADLGMRCATDDLRAVAEVLARQVEYADVVVTPFGLGSGVALLSHLNPRARMTPVSIVDASSLLGARLHDPIASAGWVEPGTMTAPLEPTYGGVTTAVWRARLPFHAQRLYDALPSLVDGIARSRGSVWLASHPDTRFCWDGAGRNLSLGSLGPWLVDLDPERWHEVGPTYRASAALDWHPVLGDRGSQLALTGTGVDPDEVAALLDSCLVTPDELVAPGIAATLAPDPFADLLEEPSR